MKIYFSIGYVTQYKNATTFFFFLTKQDSGLSVFLISNCVGCQIPCIFCKMWHMPFQRVWNLEGKFVFFLILLKFGTSHFLVKSFKPSQLLWAIKAIHSLLEKKGVISCTELFNIGTYSILKSIQITFFKTLLTVYIQM